MSISAIKDRAIDYAPCRYNGSRLWFRGPERTLTSDYVACLGGSSVYGRYLSEPLPDLLNARIDPRVVNLGVENAGVDAYLNDPGALLTAARAKIAIIQLSDSHNTSNRYYSVHPRRNDRFLTASATLRALYPEMDFTEVHFTRHLLSRLRAICPQRFVLIAHEVRQAWLARMRSLIGQMSGDVVLLWFAPVPLLDKGALHTGADIFLDRGTVDALRPRVCKTVEVVSPDWNRNRFQMQVPALDTLRARSLAGPVAHRQAADALAQAIRPLMN